MLKVFKKTFKEEEVSKDLDIVINNLEEATKDKGISIQNIIEVDIKIFQCLKQPEYGIQLIDDIFMYIEEAFREARDEKEKELVKKHASLAIRTLIKMKHAFLLFAYKSKEEEARKVLEASLITFIKGMQSVLQTQGITLPLAVKDILSSLISAKSFLERIISFLWARKEYIEKREQFVWVVKKILEKLHRQHHFFDKTHDFAEAVRTAIELLDKYKTEYLKEEEKNFKRKFDILQIIFLSLATLWVLLLVIIYLFSWIPSAILNLTWAATTLSWLKTNFFISLGIGVLLFLVPTILAKSIYFYGKIKLWSFKRKMLKLAQQIENSSLSHS